MNDEDFKEMVRVLKEKSLTPEEAEELLKEIREKLNEQ